MFEGCCDVLSGCLSTAMWLIACCEWLFEQCNGVLTRLEYSEWLFKCCSRIEKNVLCLFKHCDGVLSSCFVFAM